MKTTSTRKLISLFILFGILSFACTIGQTVSPPNEPSIPLETMVAMTLAAVRGDEVAHDLPDNADGDTNNDVPADADTPVPVGDTPVPTETSVPTETPTQTPTSTSVATSTTVAGDPKIALGNPDWKDSFNSTSSWFLYDITNFKADIVGGFFTYLIREPKFFSAWTISWPELEKYYLEVTAFTPDTCSGKDRYGLFFGAPLKKTDDGYLFEVSCDRSFRLGSYDGSESDYVLLLPWQTHSAINAGGNQSHRLGVMVDGDNIKLYVNGILVGEVNDGKFTGKQRFGFLIGSENTDDFEVKFDDIQYWVLP